MAVKLASLKKKKSPKKKKINRSLLVHAQSQICPGATSIPFSPHHCAAARLAFSRPIFLKKALLSFLPFPFLSP